MENVVIIWWWPAGNSAAIYAARANLNPIMYEGFFAGWVAAGGQLTTTTDVENYPGYTSIGWPELMLKMREQALHCGARIETKTVDAVDFSAWPYKLTVGKETIEAKSVIISTGATAKRMWVPGEELYRQKGISACAVCDGALPLFRNKVLVVVGWGDTACEEWLYLTKFASKVIMLVRRDAMRASKAMQERVAKNEKIEIHWNTTLVSIQGDDNLMSGVTVEDVNTKAQSTIEASGLFYAIGHTPNTSFLQGQLNVDENWYLITYATLAEQAISWKVILTPEQDAKFKDGMSIRLRRRPRSCLSPSYYLCRDRLYGGARCWKMVGRERIKRQDAGRKLQESLSVI
jgi:thioredoxin reductase (NADPH)